MTEEEINELLQQFPEMRELVAHLLRRHVDTILNVGGRGADSDGSRPGIPI